MGYVEKIRRHGLAGSLRIGQEMLQRKIAPLHCRLWNAPDYGNLGPQPARAQGPAGLCHRPGRAA